MTPASPKIVLAHDYLTQAGGAERVVGVFATRWPEAEIRTLLYQPESTFSQFREHRVITSRLQPLARHVSHRALLPLFPLGLRSVRIDDADLVLSSSSGWMHGVRVPDGVPHVCYCHNPARWLYDTDRYLEGRRGMAQALSPVLAALRRWDIHAAGRATTYIANSRNVQERIRLTYRREAQVVHPPVDVESFSHTPLRDDGYLLVVSRLLRYKRVDLAIEAGRRAGIPVVIVGAGPELGRLQALGGPGVTFLGRVPDADLPGLYAGARALFLGGEEDFGITPLEANASGRPVVAYGRGGALETMVHGDTGFLFSEQTPESATAALTRVFARSWDPAALAANAARFSPERFLRKMDAVIAAHLD